MMCEGWGHCRVSLTAIIERSGGGGGGQKGVGDILLGRLKLKRQTTSIDAPHYLIHLRCFPK